MQPASGLRSDFVGGLQPSPQSFEAGGGREDLTLTAVEADRLPRRLSGGGILHAAESYAVEARLAALGWKRADAAIFAASLSRRAPPRPLPPPSLSLSLCEPRATK